MKHAAVRIALGMLLSWSMAGGVCAQLRPLGGGVNAEGSEGHSPVVGPEEQELFFARANHPQNFGQEDLPDIWMSSRASDGSWGHAVNLGALVNSPDEDYPVALTKNNTSLYLASTRYNAEYPMLYRSNRQGRLWDLAEPVVIEDHYSYDPDVRYTVSFDGQVCIFSANRDESEGGLDLFVSFQEDEQGLFSFPLPLGEMVNTEKDESFPFLASDGRTLYFVRRKEGSSEGVLYRTSRLGEDWNGWSEPEIVQVGTEDFSRFSFFLSFSGKTAYLSAGKPSMIQEFTFVQPQQKEPMLRISGVVRDIRSSQPLRAGIALLDRFGRQLQEVRSISGEFEFLTPQASGLMLDARVTGYLPILRWISYPQASREEIDYGSGEAGTTGEAGAMVVHSPRAERIEMWLQRLESEVERFEDKRRKQLENKPPEVPELGVLPGIERLEQEYEIRYYAADVPRKMAETLDIKSPPAAPVEEDKDDSDAGLDSLRAKYQKYALDLAAAQDTLRAAAEVEERARLDMPFSELAEAAHWEMLTRLSPESIVKLREELMVSTPSQIESRLPDYLQGRMKSEDWQEVAERLFFYAPVSLGRRNPTSLAFLTASEDLSDYWNRLMSAIEPGVRQQLDSELLPGLRKELRQELEYQTFLQLRRKLKSELEGELMESLQERTAQNAPANREGLRDLPTTPEQENENIRSDLLFVPAEPGQTFELEDGQFAANQPQLLPELVRQLDQLAALLKAYPQLRLEIGCHTNGQVEQSYARALTQLRADAIIDYLLIQGVAQSRIRGKGYGNDQPVSEGSTPDDHLLNQRVEVRIVEW